VYLVRHGEQAPADSSAADGGLSELGRRQATLLGRRLPGTRRGRGRPASSGQGLTIVRWEPDRAPVLICFNDVGHLSAVDRDY
jgi:broad specificity phosphatase PhoE